MSKIVNAESLETTVQRRAALAILEAGLAAIDTAEVVRRQVSYDGRTLTICGRAFDLSAVRQLHVIGFGKASCAAAAALEEVLGSRISSGLVIGTNPAACEIIATVTGTHPTPSPGNFAHSQRMMLQYQDTSEDDLIIVLVSGGGSALLCWPMTECEQGARLYEAAGHADLTIRELNLVRKHLSAVKGGGLMKMLWPARVIGLIFSDVPGGEHDMVASGPTYFDASTAADAQAVIALHNLGTFVLNETPKERKYFERVENIVIVSNGEATAAMAARAREIGYEPEVIGNDFFDTPARAIERLMAASPKATCVLAGGEFRVQIPQHAGRGGRNGNAAAVALAFIRREDLFAALASDGSDNSDAAGAIADSVTKRHIAEKGLDAAASARTCDTYPLFAESGDLILTGPTGSNVSDLMLLLRGDPKSAPTT